MAEVMKMEVRQSCGLTRPVKAMSDIVSPMPGVIVKGPRHI